MQGRITHHNPQRGMVAVETDKGYSIFELVCDFAYEIGDVVSWTPDTACGHTKLRNVTQKFTEEVFFQNHWVSPQQLSQQLLIR